MDEVERNLLIKAHSERVSAMARMLACKLRRSGWRELAPDLEQEGFRAMIEAAGRYDPADPRGASFWTFICSPVRGAMLDYLNRERRGTAEMFHGKRSGVRVLSPEPEIVREVDLARAAQKLTRVERRVFRALRQGHKPVHIAGMLRMTPGAVSRFKKNVVKKLSAEFAA